MEIIVFSGVIMFIYTGMSLWLLFTGFDFESITWYWKYKEDSAEIFIYLKRDQLTLLNIFFWALTDIFSIIFWLNGGSPYTFIIWGKSWRTGQI